jgi:hypothetical protein
MAFASNDLNEIFFVDGAESVLNDQYKDALTSAAAHFIEQFNISHEVDVYVSKRSVVQIISASARAWHMPPSYDTGNSVVCVYVDPESHIKQNIVSLAHEMIHVWQVERGDFQGSLWKGMDLQSLPYMLQPWEIEAHGFMEEIASMYFKDKFLSKKELHEITLKTDQVFQKVVEDAQASKNKETLKKVGKVAAAIGLGALLGI